MWRSRAAITACTRTSSSRGLSPGSRRLRQAATTGALAQVEGAALWGASLALHERLGICERPGEGHQSRHLYATAYGRRAGDGHRIPAQHRGADGPWRACDHRGRPGDRKRHICRDRCAPAPLANPPGCSSADSQHEELIMWAALRRFKGDVTGCNQERTIEGGEYDHEA